MTVSFVTCNLFLMFMPRQQSYANFRLLLAAATATAATPPSLRFQAYRVYVPYALNHFLFCFVFVSATATAATAVLFKSIQWKSCRHAHFLAFQPLRNVTTLFLATESCVYPPRALSFVFYILLCFNLHYFTVCLSRVTGLPALLNGVTSVSVSRIYIFFSLLVFYFILLKKICKGKKFKKRFLLEFIY